MRKKKFPRRGDWMGYCPFSSLGHDIIDCIVTGKGIGAQGHAAWGHDKANNLATRPHDTANKGPRHCRPARACTAWPLQCVAIQNFVS